MRIGILVLFVFLVNSAAFADSAFQSSIKASRLESTTDGWHFDGELGTGGDWNFNRKMVGLEDGNTLKISADILTALSWYSNPWGIRVSLEISESLTRDPRKFLVKSDDSLMFEIFETYHMGESWGFFGQERLRSPIYLGIEKKKSDEQFVIIGLSKEKEKDVELEKTRLIGTRVVTEEADRFVTTNVFMPMHLQEAAGLFYQPIREPSIFVELRGGMAARQVFANDQFVKTIEKDKKIELQRLKNFFQYGPVAAIGIGGDVFDDLISYETEGEIFIPVGEGVTFTDLINFHFSTSLDLNFNEWVSLAWETHFERVPEIQTDLQFQSKFLLKFSYSA